MKRISVLMLLSFLGLMFLNNVSAQTLTKEEMIFLTSEWKGERFPDGRPKISDDLLKRARNVGVDDGWQILNNEGYTNQYEGNWKTVHKNVPVIGRAVTASFIPSRPDIEKNILERGWKNGFVGASNSWPISVLQEGDVYVVDCFGKVKGGTMIGDNLGTSIFAKTGTGVIFNSSARDLTGLSDIPGFNAYVRDFHPSFLVDVVLSGLNTPIRMGEAIVLPGDLVISDDEGVLFIPAHMAEEVIFTAEFYSLRAGFAIEMLKKGTYSAGQIDSEWTSPIKEHFIKWANSVPGQTKMTREQLEEFMSKRTW